MKGHQNHNLIIRLLRSKTRQKTYHIIVARKQADPNHRKDTIGQLVLINDTTSYLKIDIKRLEYYLHRNIKFSLAFARVLEMT